MPWRRDQFYQKHGRRFFKPRSYLLHAFPELAAQPNAETPQVVIEVGCGAGDTAFSLLQLNPGLTVYASDFSPYAVQTMRASPLFAKYAAEGRCKAFVWDLTSATVPDELAGVVRTQRTLACARD